MNTKACFHHISRAGPSKLREASLLLVGERLHKNKERRKMLDCRPIKSLRRHDMSSKFIYPLGQCFHINMEREFVYV
jgi:hypothetical protein